VAAANERDKNLFDQILVTDDDPAELGFDFFERAPRARHPVANFS
jgi:hypothetical protein